MNWLIHTAKGIAIGAGAILPGISSGVLCVIFGIYETLLDRVLHFFQNVKENSKFLFPLVFGGFLGVLLFSRILSYALSSFPLQTQSIFIGLILASIPSLKKQVEQKTAFHWSFALFFLLALGIGIASVFLEKTLIIQETSHISFFYLFLCGFFMSVGIVVPGVSSTIILMLLGIYSTYLTSVSELYLPVLLPMAIGLMIGCFLWMNVTQFLLDHFYGQTFWSIIGFTLGSIFVLFPTIPDILGGILCVLSITLGFVIFHVFSS